MESFGIELRRCVEAIVGEEPPEADSGLDPVLACRQWLGGRNLGLAALADPGRFSWAGSWIARVRCEDGDHAVHMFGSPSGPIDPAVAEHVHGGKIVDGWLVAPLDLHLPAALPTAHPGSGVVVALLVAPAAEAPLERVASATAVAGRGLDGDRYAAHTGTFSGPGQGYELTLVDAAVLEELGLAPELARRNVVTRGIELNALVGRRFRLGDTECVGRRLAEPCAHLERLARPGVVRPLVHRAGLRADILAGGALRVGDQISPL